MKHFADLINALESTNKTNAKIDAIIDYLERAPDEDKVWFIALFTGKRPKRNVNTNYMKEWALEITGLPFWLFQESYSSVGDLGETISLILPPPTRKIDRSLTEWMTDILHLKQKTDAEKKEFVLSSWDGLDYTERLIFNKLLGGSFRIGVSDKTLINALTKFSGQESSALMHSLMGKWQPEEASFRELISAENINPDNSKPYPFCLAYPLEKDLQDLGNPDEWLVEYKWDGIRGQIIRRNDEVFIWSRGEELVTPQFPEIEEAVKAMKGNFVIDGEILAVSNGKVLNFNELQKRLNRKTLTKKMQSEIPIEVFAYDLLELENNDLREKPISARRAMLEELLLNQAPGNITLSQTVDFGEWKNLNLIREGSRDINSEGLMLKHKDSPYHSGRKKGDWWKWKINPLTIDAVLIYAQKGSGRRSAYYTDYTFAVKNGDSLVTIAKAYSGLTDKEIMEVSRFVNKNAIEKFGPVRTVKAELVFEIAFEGIGFSNRHKSGVALRFPRILRWRKDKTVNEIDDLEEIKKLIQ
ncbi:ATP-dependent DNA ligase [uncultured Chryseobacterium sp.]|uniref:ATP-dependent DNA ligase n=1 Tax=uncultured Chryseobacterium sp. TaxID=259322 RepID=UPI0025E1956C|nr:ATP-dependent DNA ligase [uncultured Chryseobacterium sp.]